MDVRWGKCTKVHHLGTAYASVDGCDNYRPDISVDVEDPADRPCKNCKCNRDFHERKEVQRSPRQGQEPLTFSGGASEGTTVSRGSGKRSHFTEQQRYLMEKMHEDLANPATKPPDAIRKEVIEGFCLKEGVSKRSFEKFKTNRKRTLKDQAAAAQLQAAQEKIARLTARLEAAQQQRAERGDERDDGVGDGAARDGAAT